MKKSIYLITIVFLILGTACQAVPEPQIAYDPAALRFSGEQAFALETEYVNLFPDRQNGKPNNRLAGERFVQRLSTLGWDCQVDEWEVISYSQPVKLNNGVCPAARQIRSRNPGGRSPGYRRDDQPGSR